MAQEEYLVQLRVDTGSALSAVNAVERALEGIKKINFEVDSSSITGIISDLEKIEKHTTFKLNFTTNAATALKSLKDLTSNNRSLNTTVRQIGKLSESMGKLTSFPAEVSPTLKALSELSDKGDSLNNTVKQLKSLHTALSKTDFSGGSASRDNVFDGLSSDADKLINKVKTAQDALDSLGSAGGSSNGITRNRTASQYERDINNLHKQISSLEIKRQTEGLNSGEASALQDSYKAVVDLISDANSKLSDSADISKLNNAHTLAYAQAQKKVNVEVDKYFKKQQKLQDSDPLEKALSKHQSNYNRYRDESLYLTSGADKRLAVYKKTIDELEEAQKKLVASPDDTNLISAYETALRKTENEYKRFQKAYRIGDGKNYAGNIGVDLVRNSDEVQDGLKSVTRSMDKGKIVAQQYDDVTEKLNVTFKNGAGAFEKYALSYDALTGNVSSKLVSSTKSSGSISGFIERLGSKFGDLSQWAIAKVSLEQVFEVFKQGLTVVRELDTAMTELKKTSSGSTQDYEKFIADSNQTAKEIGTTTTQLTNSAADWSRLGYNLEDSKTMAKNSSILLNVSEYDNINDATEALISTMKAFNVEAEDSMTLIDKMNLVGNNYAISTDGISDALMRSSSALVAANNDIDESIALITTANEIEQDPEKVGNGLRTIALRLRGTEAAKKELEESGEEVSDYTVGVSKLQEQIKGFTKVASNDFKGFDILTDSGAYKSTYEILLGIAEVWGEIGSQSGGDLKQAALLELIAGKNRANIAASILQNPESLKEVYADSVNNYAGSAEKELNTYLDSIDAHVAKVQESWNQLWQNGITSGAVNTILDIGSAILTVVDNVGLLNSGMGLLGAGLSVFKGVGRVKVFSLNRICPHNPGGNTERTYAEMVA